MRSSRTLPLSLVAAFLLVAAVVSYIAGRPHGVTAATPAGGPTPTVFPGTAWTPRGAAMSSHPASPPHGAGRPVPPRRAPATTVPEVTDERARPAEKVVALTFDDGPGIDTTEVLDVLRREHVPATFFMLGMNVVERPDDVRRVAAAGMSVQSHTWDHENLERLSDRAIDRELTRTADAIQATIGVRPACVRPPFGATDKRVQRRIGRAGQVPVTWDVDTDDWAEPGASVIARRAVSTIRPGAVVLMHDGGGHRRQTVEALPRLIHQLRGKGYTFTALCN